MNDMNRFSHHVARTCVGGCPLACFDSVSRTLHFQQFMARTLLTMTGCSMWQGYSHWVEDVRASIMLWTAYVVCESRGKSAGSPCRVKHALTQSAEAHEC